MGGEDGGTNVDPAGSENPEGEGALDGLLDKGEAVEEEEFSEEESVASSIPEDEA